MQRYAMHFRGRASPAPDIAKLRAMPDVRIVDNEIAQLMLIETNERTADRLRAQFPDWTIEPETFYPLPEPQ